MINRFVNAIATLLGRDMDARVDKLMQQLRDEREKQKKEHRALVDEVEDLLEKWHRVIARTAMRRSREMKQALEEEQQQEQEPQNQHSHEGGGDIGDRKAALRARVYRGGRPIARVVNGEPPE